ncbi:MAG TPA: hypothetical protein VFE58_03640 [Tepidisphaeraceae bacterium]|jgi:DNA/RNA endonuclease YhcR with UshA esterase domain|nr:hypothetical protein [Tepidisphaeraceae bacterium]
MNRKLIPILPILLLSCLAADPASQPASIKVSDKSALDANKDKSVIVDGTITTAAWSKSGRVFILKFADTEDTGFTAVAFKDNKDAFDKAFNGDAAKTLTGSKVTLTGKLSAFHDKPQIVLNKPEQVKIQDAK